MAINSTSVYLSWLPPDEDQHNGDIRHYNIRIVERHSGREFQLNSTNITIIYAGLHPAYTYSFTAAAVTVGIGPYSDPAIATMPEDGMHIYLGVWFISCNNVVLNSLNNLPIFTAALRDYHFVFLFFPLYCH